MPTSHLLAFAVTSVVLVAIPGPSLLFTIGRALTVGRRAALHTVVGNAIGLLGQIVLVTLGLGALVAASAVVYSVVKYAGATYLIWLGIQAVRHRRAGLELDLGAAQSIPAGHAIRTGVVVGMTNPKTIVFFAALLPQFVDASAATPEQVQMLLLGLVFAAIAVVGDSAWALAAGTARAWFARSPQRVSRLRGAGGAMICGLGVGVALTGSTP